MNPKIILAGVGATSAVVGGVVGWTLAANRSKKKVEALTADLDQMSQMLRKKTMQIAGIQKEIDRLEIENHTWRAAFPEETPEEASALTEDPREEPPAFPEGETEEETRTALQEKIDQYTNNPQDRDVFVERAGAMIQAEKNEMPFVISRDLYSWDPDGEGDEFEKITLMYYPRQRTLLDEEEDPIEDVDSMVGWRNMNSFGGESGDPDVVFVRNRRLRTDFEVVKEDDTDLPPHVMFAMSKDEYETEQAAGTLRKFREGDM